MAFPTGEFLLPIFPLPNLVFFPQTRLPLHIFEPRYRKMVSDAMQSDERIGMILLKPGWESDYHGAPPVYECGTAGTIEHVTPLEDGRYNIILRGDVRFRILEVVTEQPYRIMRVVAAPERSPEPHEAWGHRQWLAALSQQYMELLPQQAAVPELATATLEALTNALVMSLNLDDTRKQDLLEMDDLGERANAVGAELTRRIEDAQFLHPFRRDGDPDLN